VLDAIVEGVTIVELIPAKRAWGWGVYRTQTVSSSSTPAACMARGARGRSRGAAGRGDAAAVARRVLLDTPHHLLAATARSQFARACGFETRDLMTPKVARDLA
jgi:isoaspartyl peptidase/L-asparaginase-like protein (Ntn-hydrolase superfamily)